MPRIIIWSIMSKNEKNWITFLIEFENISMFPIAMFALSSQYILAVVLEFCFYWPLNIFIMDPWGFEGKSQIKVLKYLASRTRENENMSPKTIFTGLVLVYDRWYGYCNVCIFWALLRTWDTSFHALRKLAIDVECLRLGNRWQNFLRHRVCTF